MAAEPATTPSQTIGPFFGMAGGIPWPDGPEVVPEGTAGAIRISGVLRDGAGNPVPDGVVEIWQADEHGRFDHPDDPRPGRTDFAGFGRSCTDAEGRFWFRTVKPGPLPTRDGRTEAPHLNVTVLARGMLDRVVTRIYFPDEQRANETDPVLSTVDPERRGTLIADRDGTDGDESDQDGADQDGDQYRIDIHLQGADETVFFAV